MIIIGVYGIDMTISFTRSGTTITAFSGGVGALVIPGDVTAIASNAFYSNQFITSLYFALPSSLTVIGGSAFSGCSLLTGDLTLPSSLTSIEAYAFSGCGFTGNLTIPTGIITIGDSAFSVCSFVGTLTIPNTVTSIGFQAFAYCSGLSGTILIDTSIVTVGFQAFYGCTQLNLQITYTDTNTCTYTFTVLEENNVELTAFAWGTTNVSINLNAIETEINKTIVLIGDGVFNLSSILTGVTISNNVTSIGANAFNSCVNLSLVTIPNSVTSIGANAFNSCVNLSLVTIPNSVTSIGANAFFGCSNFIGGTLTIPASVKHIGQGAFVDSNITKIVLEGDGSDLILGEYIVNNPTIEAYAGTQWIGPLSIGSENVDNTISEITIIIDHPDPSSTTINTPPNPTTGASSLVSAAQAIADGGNVPTGPTGVAALVIVATKTPDSYTLLPADTNAVLSGQDAVDFIAVYKANKPTSTLVSPVTIATPSITGVIPTPPASGSFYLAVSSAVSATYTYANSLDTLEVNADQHIFHPGYGQSLNPVILSVGTPYTHMYTDPMTNTVVTQDLVVDALGSFSSHTTQSGVACFLADAPVLTPAGYRRIASLRNGDLVVTATGASVPIQAVTAQPVAASTRVNPFVIPKGRFGALRDLAISPDHKVAVGDKMVEARALGLRQKHMTGVFMYYNLELPDHENMVVAGVTVESQYPIRRVTVTMAEFREMLVAKYGRLTPAILVSVQKKVRFLTDGRVVVPVDKRVA